MERAIYGKLGGTFGDPLRPFWSIKNVSCFLLSQEALRSGVCMVIFFLKSHEDDLGRLADLCSHKQQLET